MQISPRHPGRHPGPALALAVVVAFVGVPESSGQQPANPVYVDDAPGAADTLARARDLASAGNLVESARVLQRLLDDDAGRMTPQRGTPDLYRSVRAAVHDALLENEGLLEAYRTQERENAERLVMSGRAEAAERTRLLTEPGLEGALVVAQRRLESAQFHAAMRVLRGLERHPDRLAGGRAARAAADLATLVAQYIADPASRALAQRWRAEAGLDLEFGEAIEPPPSPRSITPFTAVGDLDLRSLVPSPLHSHALSIAVNAADVEAEQQRIGARRARAQQPVASQQFVLPTLAGDTIFINDGRSISAWDRFSLSTIWTTEVGDIDSERLRRVASRRPVEDACTVTIADSWVVGVTGVAVDGAREGDPRIYALDAATGDLRWRVDPSLLDTSLEASSVRGPLIVDQGVVVAAVAKHVRQRRLVSIHLAGLDLVTGALLWSRPVGSTGALPYGASTLPGEAGTVDAGVVYRSDRLGFIAAIETVTGRPLWVRRMTTGAQRGPEPAPWLVSAPIVVDGVVYTLTPDRASVVALDAATGEMLGARDADEVGAPLYTLRARDTLLFVGVSTITTLPVDGFDSASPRRIVGPQREAFTGRVVVAGDRALAPIDAGILVAPLSEGAAELEVLPIDHTGNLLATESQIVTIDDDAVHSYLLWDVAERILLERMAERPDDPGPAATFAELAYRDGREDRIVPAVEAALEAIERAPMRDDVIRVRSQLFQSVLAMVQPPTGESPRVVLDRATRFALFERLDRLAATPNQRVERLIAAGVFFERGGDIPRAVESYQQILSDQTLSEVRVSLAQTSRPADDEAAARLRAIVREHGRGVYAPFEAEATRALANARLQSGVAPLEAVARRYPVAGAAAEAWVESSRRHDQAGRPRAAIAGLEEAMRIADDAGIGDDALVGRIGGSLVRLLMANDRVAAASALLDRLGAERPRLLLTDGQGTLDVAGLRAELATLSARLDRRPIIGPLRTEAPPQIIQGVVAMPPVLNPVSGAPTEVILLASPDEFTLWEVDLRSGLRQRWATAREPDDVPVLLDETGVLLSRRTAEGRMLVRFDLARGDVLWSTTVLPAVRGEARALVDTPLGVRRSVREALVSVDDGVVTLVERSGRVVAVDLATGRTLWATETLDRVYDAATGDGVLVVAGAVDLPQQAADAGARDPSELERAAIVAFDLRTGRPLQRLQPEGGQVRWIRMTPEGEALIGLDRGVASYEIADGRRRWFTGGVAGAESVDAWVFPGRVIVMDRAGELRQIETEDGAHRLQALATRGRFNGYGSGLRPVWPAALNDRAAFATQNGLLLFDRQGELVGADHRNAARLLSPVGYGRDSVVVIDQQVAEQDAQGVWFRVLVFDAASLSLAAEHALRLGAQPERIDLLDGRVLISAGLATVVLDAPETEQSPNTVNAPQLGPGDEIPGRSLDERP